MTVKQEDKLRNGIFILGFLYSLFSSKIIKDDEVRMFVSIPALIVIAILLYRKIARDKKEGKVVDKYESVWFWLIVVVLILGVIMLITNFFYPDLMHKSII